MNEPVVEDVDDLLTLTSGDSNQLSSLLSSGKAQEAKQQVRKYPIRPYFLCKNVS